MAARRPRPAAAAPCRRTRAGSSGPSGTWAAARLPAWRPRAGSDRVPSQSRSSRNCSRSSPPPPWPRPAGRGSAGRPPQAVWRSASARCAATWACPTCRLSSAGGRTRPRSAPGRSLSPARPPHRRFAARPARFRGRATCPAPWWCGACSGVASSPVGAGPFDGPSTSIGSAPKPGTCGADSEKGRSRPCRPSRRPRQPPSRLPRNCRRPDPHPGAGTAGPRRWSHAGGRVLRRPGALPRCACRA